MSRPIGKTLLALLPAVAATAALAAPAVAATPATSAPAAPAAAASYPSSRTITVAEDDQDTSYYCGPAAVRNALSGRGIYTVQSDLAGEMGTDVNGTDSVADVTPVLNRHAGTGWYESKYISGYTASQAAKDLLRRDVLLDVNNGYVIVANVVGTGTDTAGGHHTYSGGHYIDVVGYSSDGAVSRIYDPADNTSYSMSTDALATWIAERGYSA